MDETDAELIARLRRYSEGCDPSSVLEAADRIEALAAVVAERDALRGELTAYLGAWAAEHARRMGLPDGHLHPQHFDRLAELGCRLDSFTRAKLEAQNG